MASSGVSVDPSCQEVFQQLKLGKKLKYIIFALNDTNTAIIVQKSSDSTDYEEFLGDLPEDLCRWAVYDFEYEKEEGAGKRNKLCFVTWSPDGAKIKNKMVYASSKDALRRALGVALEIQATDFSEVAYESVLDKVSRGH